MTTPSAPSSLAADLLARGVTFNPRFVRPSRLPRWPRIGTAQGEGVVVRFADGVLAVPRVSAKDDPSALRLRDVRGETLLRDGGEIAGTVGLLRMPPGFGEASPSRIPFPAFLAPLPGVLAVLLDGEGSFVGEGRCRFCPAAANGAAPRVVDLAEGFARFGPSRHPHLSLCCRHRHDPGLLGAALDAAEAVLGPGPRSVEIPPADGKEPLRTLAARGVSQMIVCLDAPSEALFRERCPGRAASVGWDALRRQVDDGLAVFGKGGVGVRMILYPGDLPAAFPLLRKFAAGGAVPVVLPYTPEEATAHDPAALRQFAGRLAVAGRGRLLAIDPYAGWSLHAGGGARPIPWYRALLARLGFGKGGRR